MTISKSQLIRMSIGVPLYPMLFAWVLFIQPTTTWGNVWWIGGGIVFLLSLYWVMRPIDQTPYKNLFNAIAILFTSPVLLVAVQGWGGNGFSWSVPIITLILCGINFYRYLSKKEDLEKSEAELS